MTIVKKKSKKDTGIQTATKASAITQSYKQ